MLFHCQADFQSSAKRKKAQVDVSDRLFDLLQTMRGFPPIQIFILALLFGLMAVPLVRLTGNAPEQPSSQTQEVADASASKAVPAWIRVRHAHKPLKLSLKSDGKELLQHQDLSESLIEFESSFPISKDGHEISLEASWPPGTPDTAVTVEIEPEGHDARSETRWSSEAAMQEILSFTW